MGNLADLRLQQAKSSEAISILGGALRSPSNSLGSTHSSTLAMRQRLADVLLEAGRIDEAQVSAKKLVSQCRRVSKDSSTTSDGARTARALETLAAALERASHTSKRPVLEEKVDA